MTVQDEVVADESHSVAEQVPGVPKWYKTFTSLGPLHPTVINSILPYLLQMKFDGHPLIYTSLDKWHYLVDGEVTRLPTATKQRTLNVLSQSHGLPGFNSRRLTVHHCREDVLGTCDAIQRNATSPSSRSQLTLRTVCVHACRQA